MLVTALLLIFPFFMAFAATSDLVSMTISNKVSIGLIIGFVICAYAIGMDIATFGTHWFTFAIVLTGGFALFAFGVIGGGDAKLAASTALWLGMEHTLDYIIYASMLGGILTLFLLGMRAHPVPFLIQRVKWIATLYRVDKGIPYGIALALAALSVYPDTVWMDRVSAIVNHH